MGNLPPILVYIITTMLYCIPYHTCHVEGKGEKTVGQVKTALHLLEVNNKFYKRRRNYIIQKNF